MCTQARISSADGLQGARRKAVLLTTTATLSAELSASRSRAGRALGERQRGPWQGRPGPGLAPGRGTCWLWLAPVSLASLVASRRPSPIGRGDGPNGTSERGPEGPKVHSGGVRMRPGRTQRSAVAPRGLYTTPTTTMAVTEPPSRPAAKPSPSVFQVHRGAKEQGGIPAKFGRP